MCVGPPSDPRLRRALYAYGIQGCPLPEPALQTSLRRRLRLGHDPTAQTGIEALGISFKEHYGASVYRLSRTPVGEERPAFNLV